MVISSMTTLAADPRAEVCPECRGVVTSRVEKGELYNWYDVACLKNSALNDTINLYYAVKIVECKQCDYEQIADTTYRERICSH